MKKRAAAAALVASTTALVGLTVVSPAPALASDVCEVLHFCGDFKHRSPDAGFDDPIPVTCDWNKLWGNYQTVAEGKSATCHDVDGFYVGVNREVTCLIQGTTDSWVKYDDQGWVKINDRQDMNCVHGLD